MKKGGTAEGKHRSGKGVKPSAEDERVTTRAASHELLRARWNHRRPREE